MVTEILKKLDDRYGSEETPLSIQRGKIHDYLGMTLDYSVPGK